MEQQEKQLLEDAIKTLLELRKVLSKEEKDESSEEASEGESTRVKARLLG